MKFPLYANGIPNTTVLFLESKNDLDIRGYDVNRANTVYFDQRINGKAGLEALNRDGLLLDIPLPPDKYMMVEITDADKNTSSAKLRDIQTIPLRTKAVYLDAADEEYVNCAEWFSYNCGTMPPGKTPKRGKVEFEYFWQMLDDDGRGRLVYSDTPARVDHDSGIVQVSKKFFDQYTIPMRVFILMHERIHYRYDTTSESECDRNALNICLSLGYPKLELIYAATKIFSNDPESRKRVDAMIKFINNW